MKLESANDVFFVFAVLVPGFIFSAVLSQLLPRRQAGTTESAILGYLTGTAVNYAICGYPLYLVLTGALLKGDLLAQTAVWFITIFITPLILAVLTGAVIQRDWAAWFFSKLHLRWVNFIPTGWDWIFSRTEPCFVLVTLQSGEVVAGYFGPKSMASSDANCRDLYLERQYKVMGNGPWAAVEDSHGIYITGPQIAHIEFRIGG